MFKFDNFGVILFVSFSYKKLLQYSFYENLKNRCKNRFFRKKFKKVCVLQRRACNKFKRDYLENYNDSEHAVKTKNAPFFMNFLNINKNWQIFSHYTGFLRIYLSTFLTPISTVLSKALIKKIKKLKKSFDNFTDSKLTSALLEIKLINRIKNEDKLLEIINQHYSYKFS